MGAAHIDVGDVQRAMRTGIVADEQHFRQVVNGDDRALPVGDRFGLHPDPGAGKNAAPAFTDRYFAKQADAGWVNADGFLVLGPHQHQQIGIAMADGVVEGVLDIVGRGVVAGLAHGAIHSRQCVSTDSGVSLFRQSRWPSGHSRLWQGEHARCSDMSSRRSVSGGVLS